ncbi:MAG: 5-methylcytosine restriction system specificity protein McrC [Lachnospiraceae bacterium]|jgi:5-methylcytosine-specific restriction enzyme subunit McrC
MKITVVEYSAGVSLDSIFHNPADFDEIYSGVRKANKRISANLKINRDTLQISDGRLRALGIAGVIQLTNNIEIEIIPKFLGHDVDTDWKATLYLLSTLSKHGSILTAEKITASTSYLNSLYEIAGRILAQEYLKCRRKPLRQYRKEQFWDYAIDGEMELSVLFERHPDGIEQSRICFDRLNAYNATIREAMKIVQPFTTDSQVKNILSIAVSELGHQGLPSKQRLLIPARNKEWQPAYDLSFDIVKGLGSSYDAGRFVAPGFVVDTWQLWEWLITTGMRIGNSKQTVLPQNSVCWGYKETKIGKYTVNVFPDIEVVAKDGQLTPLYLLDAKYKLIKNATTGEIERDDLYEAFAFCSATDTNEIILVYPANDPADIPGYVKKCSTYYVKDVMIHVVQVAFGSIKEKGGIYAFSANLRSGIESILKSS